MKPDLEKREDLLELEMETLTNDFLAVRERLEAEIRALRDEVEGIKGLLRHLHPDLPLPTEERTTR